MICSWHDNTSASVICLRTVWLVMFGKIFAQIVVSCIMTHRVVPWIGTEVSEEYGLRSSGLLGIATK